MEIILQNAINAYEEFSDYFDEVLLRFCHDKCADRSEFNKIKEMIGPVEVKSNPRLKILKFAQQIYAFVYQKLMDFLSGRFDFDALNTQNRFIHYNSKLLYTLLKMQEMSNLNNLHNAQDVILFL